MVDCGHFSERIHMKAFLEKGKTAYMVRVRSGAGAWVYRGTGTGDQGAADAMADMVGVLIAKQAWDVLDPIIAKALAVADAFRHWIAAPRRKHSRTNQMMEPSDDERLQFIRDTLNVIDLDPMVAEWSKQRGVSPIYVQQVRRLIVAGTVFPLAQYTTARLAMHIKKEIGVCETTMRRYKAGHSAFVKHLMELGHLTTNITRDLNLPSMPDYEPEFLEMADAKRLILSLTGEQRAMEALMAGSGIEVGGCITLQRRDVDVARRIVMVHPTTEQRFKRRKNKNRSRPIDITEDWAWDIFHEHIKYLMPDAPVFPNLISVAGRTREGRGTNPRAVGGKRSRAPLDRHQAACTAMGLPETTLHAYRHTFATAWIDRGILMGVRMPDGSVRDLNWLRDQLGHARNSMLIITTYGVRLRQYEKTHAADRRLSFTATGT